jgi:Uncharacterized alpha/beta hydrolase domain (DUF2235)
VLDQGDKLTEQKPETSNTAPVAEESPSNTSFTSHGAIPPVSSAAPAAPSAPSASDRAFGGLEAKGEALLDRLLHRNTPPSESELAELTPDQRADYDRIIASNGNSPHPIAPSAALKNAKSGRPLTDEDRAAIAEVQAKMASLKVTSIDNHDPNQVQMEISFDGTWNDRDEMAFQTNPALINELFDGPAENKIYEVGVGTSEETKLIGGATGLGIHERIKDAYKRLVARINAVKTTNPKANVVLIVSGFSRGATAARAFTNELNRLGVPDLGSQLPDGSYGHMYETPKIGAMMLFDTVGSVGLAGDERNENLDGSKLDLSIPKNAQNVMQLTARDEKRKTFPLSSAVDPDHEADPRINEFALPGAHSDIGGGYPNPYSQIPLQLGLEFLQKTGVNMKPNPAAPVSASDPSNRLHESRDPIEQVIGGPDEQRTVFPSKNPQ